MSEAVGYDSPLEVLSNVYVISYIFSDFQTVNYRLDVLAVKGD